MDINILAALMDRKRFRHLAHAVPEQMLEPETIGMLRWFSVYWAAFPEHTHIDVDSLKKLVSEL